MTSQGTPLRVTALDKPGLFATLFSCTAWGLFPIYWYYLARVSAIETMSHRIIWSFVFYIFVAGLKDPHQALNLLKNYITDKKQIRAVSLASFFIGFNWTLYIWAVTHGYVIQSSLGYFISPLLNVAIGALVFKERLSRLQKVSIFFAAVGVIYLTILYGKPPLVALGLAFSFSGYGIMKKTIPGNTSVISVIETLILLPIGIIGAFGIRILSSHGETLSTAPSLWGSLFQSPEVLSTAEWTLLLGGGLVTGLPLLLYSYGAQRLPFSILGFSHYISPTIQFLTGLLLFHEAIDSAQLMGFSLIWFALGLFLFHLWQSQRPFLLRRSL